MRIRDSSQDNRLIERIEDVDDEHQSIPDEDERRLKIAIKEDWRYAGHTDIPLKKITPETKTIEDGINK